MPSRTAIRVLALLAAAVLLAGARCALACSTGLCAPSSSSSCPHHRAPAHPAPSVCWSQPAAAISPAPPPAPQPLPAALPASTPPFSPPAPAAFIAAVSSPPPASPPHSCSVLLL